jgi:hypothetical protein
MASREVRGKGGGECVCVPNDKHGTMHHCHSRGVVVSVGGAAVGITAIHSLDLVLLVVDWPHATTKPLAPLSGTTA